MIARVRGDGSAAEAVVRKGHSTCRQPRFIARLWAAAVLLCCALGCGEEAGADRTDAGSATDAGVPYLAVLHSPADFDRLAESTSASGGETHVVKYLARIDGKASPPGLSDECYFQNMKRTAWHLHFLQSFPELRGLSYDAYRSLVTNSTTRRLWGGALQRWTDALHPLTREPGVYAYSIYSEPGGLSVPAIAEVDARIKRCAPFAGERFVFVPEMPDQQALVDQERIAFSDAGIAVLLPKALAGELVYTAYTNGESYGYLRVVPRGAELEEYGPRDVIIVESAPNDISIVAGLVTRNPQSELGHVNLRLREKRIPNASVPDVYDRSEVAVLADRLVHVVVEDARFVLERAELADAEAFWEQRRPQIRKPSFDLEPKELEPLTKLRATDMHAYGAKCANLGELTRVLSPPHRPDGFGIPLVHYRDFMMTSGLDGEVDALLTDEPNLDAKARRESLRQLRDRIKATAPAPELLQAIAAAIDAVFGDAARTQFLRFRSSTNVEDLDAFTGAGLYDSRSGCLGDDLDDDAVGPSACLQPAKAADIEQQLASYRVELAEHPDRSYLSHLIQDAEEDLTEEKPLSTVLGKVWASLWNDRAFDERAYYGIDHRLAYMGICVHPAYALERVNAVAVSNLVVDDGAPMYRLNSQVGELSVARPEIPSAVSEVLTFRRAEDSPIPSDLSLRVGSSLVPEGQRVWPDAELNLLGELLFRVQDHFAREVYSQISPLALDFEVKLDHDGAVVIKQIRPYLSSEPAARSTR